jgi:hypothetical protein
MRLVRVLVAERVLDDWLELLEQHPIDYVVTPKKAAVKTQFSSSFRCRRLPSMTCWRTSGKRASIANTP